MTGPDHYRKAEELEAADNAEDPERPASSSCMPPRRSTVRNA
jgi:hypothetical protein